MQYWDKAPLLDLGINLRNKPRTFSLWGDRANHCITLRPRKEKTRHILPIMYDIQMKQKFKKGFKGIVNSKSAMILLHT